MLTKSMKKARKKRRLESEDDMSDVLLQAEKARIKVKVISVLLILQV